MRGKQIVLPIALRYEVVEAHHKQLGHLGAARTVSAVAEHYTWSGMQSHISEYRCQLPNLHSKQGQSFSQGATTTLLTG